MLTSLFVIGLRKSDLIPVIIFCQVFAMTVICYRMEMVVPLLVLAFTVKGLVIPLLFYYLVRKTIVFEQNPSVIPVSAAIALVLVIFSASSLFAHHLHAGPFAMAAVFTALIGVLCIASRKTFVGQVAGFIVLQNGIFAFTSSFCLKFTFAMEILLALDVLLSILIMMYAIQTIYKASGNVDIKTFNSLRG